MVRSSWILAAVSLSCAYLPGAQACAGGTGRLATLESRPSAAPAGSTTPAKEGPKVLIGAITREQVEAAAPAWVQAGVEAKPDLAAAHALATVESGAEVTIFLGTWCGDSRREVSRLWRALDEIGATAQGGAAGGLPFTLTYIGVDEAKRLPAAEVAAVGLQYVPTLIVRRSGREVGRIVEQSPHGVEVDLLALLAGKAAGLVTASPQMTPQASPPPHPPS